jgi:hypothetical protein
LPALLCWLTFFVGLDERRRRGGGRRRKKKRVND